jgi:hypothetical protein
MKKLESPLFLAFADKHFGPKEQLLYLLQVQNVSSEGKLGRQEKLLETQDGDSCVTYYFYDKTLDVVYVLAGHLIRKGEPKPSDSNLVAGYIARIENGEEPWYATEEDP